MESENTGDGLSVGLTRPTMLLHIPYNAAVAVFMIGSLALVIDVFRMIWVGPGLYAVCLALAKWEPRFFDILKVWARTSARYPAMHWKLWRACSYTPLPVRLPHDK